MIRAPWTIKGRYCVLAASSASADAVLYEAQDLATGEPVMLELLRAEFAVDREFAEAVRDQASRLAQPACANPALLAVLECGATDEGDVYVVLERVAGRSLRAVFDDHRAFDAASALRITIQIGEALETLHLNGIVHGELRPESVLLVDDDRGPDSVKLVGVEFTEAHRTSAGLRVRDPSILPYLMPLERVGAGLTEAADVYALGLVLYELVTAERPDPGRPPSSRVPTGLTRVIDKALDPLPGRRYLNVSAMLNDLWSASCASPMDAPTSSPQPAHAATVSGRKVHGSVIAALIAGAGSIAVVVATTFLGKVPEPSAVRPATIPLAAPHIAPNPSAASSQTRERSVQVRRPPPLRSDTPRDAQDLAATGDRSDGTAIIDWLLQHRERVRPRPATRPD